MATNWIRREFSSVGLTQNPPGPHLRALQANLTGTVVLMIDVSGSMAGERIRQAVQGARTFVAEAVEAHYRVGVMLWDTRVVALSDPSVDPSGALAVLGAAHDGGGTSVLGPLVECHALLAPRGGDRVVALFCDGDLTPVEAVLARVATMRAEGIRFIVRGLGDAGSGILERISDEGGDGTTTVATVENLASGIASMATSLRSTTAISG